MNLIKNIDYKDMVGNIYFLIATLGLINVVVSMTQ